MTHRYTISELKAVIAKISEILPHGLNISTGDIKISILISKELEVDTEVDFDPDDPEPGETVIPIRSRN